MQFFQAECHVCLTKKKKIKVNQDSSENNQLHYFSQEKNREVKNPLVQLKVFFKELWYYSGEDCMGESH